MSGRRQDLSGTERLWVGEVWWLLPWMYLLLSLHAYAGDGGVLGTISIFPVTRSLNSPDLSFFN